MQINSISVSFNAVFSKNTVHNKLNNSQLHSSESPTNNEATLIVSPDSDSFSNTNIAQSQMKEWDMDRISDRNRGMKSVIEELHQNYSLEWKNSDAIPYDALNKFYSFHLNDKNFENYVTVATKSGDNFETFMNTASSLYYGGISGSEEELEGFLDFSAQLSEEELNHFLTALKDNPNELDNIMDIASKMGKDALSSYLEAASFAGEDLEQFNNTVSEMMAGQSDLEHLTTWLDAAAQSGEQVMGFLSATVNLSEESRNRVSAHIVNQLEEDSEKNFIQFIQSAEEDKINDLLDVSETLNEDDMDNLMDAAAGAQYQVEDFITRLNDVSTLRPEQMSDFLATASRSESEMATFLKMSDKIDLEFTGRLSTVDTVNFLKAAANTTSIGGQDRIDKIAKELTDGEDLSNFLYAASIQTSSGMEDFLSQVEGMENPDERSDFITEIANQGNKVMERGVYMKGMLSDDEYIDFQASLDASQFNDTSFREFVENIGEFDGESRSIFLDAAASSESEARDFMAMFDQLSYEKRGSFLEISSKLGETEQGKFIHEALRARDNISNFIDVSKRVQENAQTEFVFNDFLSALSNTEDADEHQALIDFVGKLGIGQQRSFLSVASSPDRDISELMDLGNKMLFTSKGENGAYSPFNFIKMFDAIAAGTENERNLMGDIDYFIKNTIIMDEEHSPGSFVQVYV